MFAGLEAAQHVSSAGTSNRRALRVGVPGYEDVDVHLPRNRAERVQVTYRDALVPVNDANLDGAVDNRYRGRKC